MKALAFFVANVVVVSAACALSLGETSAHFSTNTEFVWRVPTNQLRPQYWIYKRLPRVFPATTISNGIVLSGLQGKGIPKPSTNQITIWADHLEGDPRPAYFSLDPELASMSYDIGTAGADYMNDDTPDDVVIKSAWKYATRFGLDRTQLAQGKVENRGISLARLIDGIEVREAMEGFSLQFCCHGKIRDFSITWPQLGRWKNEQAATPQQFIACIKAYKTPLLPESDEPDYFARIKRVATATRLTITNVTPYYVEGLYGETAQGNEPPKWVTPVAELEAVADFGSGNATVRIFSPILSSDVTRLLTK